METASPVSTLQAGSALLKIVVHAVDTHVVSVYEADVRLILVFPNCVTADIVVGY